MTKKVLLRLLLLAMVTLGPTVSHAMLDGNSPPSCNPFVDPNCGLPPAN